MSSWNKQKQTETSGYKDVDIRPEGNDKSRT